VNNIYGVQRGGGGCGVHGVDLGLECRFFGWEARFTGTDLFVAHLAHQDWHRLTEERAAGDGCGFEVLTDDGLT
jgi:hypothetical protein